MLCPTKVKVTNEKTGQLWSFFMAIDCEIPAINEDGVVC